MKCSIRTGRDAAFSLTDSFILLVSVTLVFLIYWLIRPGGCRIKGKSLRVHCTSNLRQVALSYHLWSQDNAKDFPMTLAASDGGTRESALLGNILPSILIASNQLRTPSLLICPEDSKSKAAKSLADLTLNNIGYFLNIDASLTNQNQILAGDRNLIMTRSPVKRGFLQVTNAADIQWANWLHAGGGNVALIDGSAHQVTSHGLRSLVANSPTNRFIIP